jgi:hypothetical protein
VDAIALQTDGKIIIGGGFPLFAGVERDNIARLNPDGSLDATFDPRAYGVIYSLALQRDGKLVAGGAFTILAGTSRQYLARLDNTVPATESLGAAEPGLIWRRGGSSSEAYRTTFDVSTNGTGWTPCGAGVRVAGGWRLPSFPAQPGESIRARAFIPGGQHNGSSWYYESIFSPPPMIVLDKPGLGMLSNQFVFDVVGPAAQEAVVETSDDLVSWTPVQTNSFLSGQARFTNAASTTPFTAYRAGVR